MVLFTINIFLKTDFKFFRLKKKTYDLVAALIENLQLNFTKCFKCSYKVFHISYLKT